MTDTDKLKADTYFVRISHILIYGFVTGMIVGITIGFLTMNWLCNQR